MARDAPGMGVGVKHWHELTTEQQQNFIAAYNMIIGEPETCPNCGVTGSQATGNYPFRLWHEGNSRETYICLHCGWFETFDKH